MQLIHDYLVGGCPHRSERTENFQTISVEIRGRDSLEASLAEYVKGELLEGDNAYYCESCQKKVTTTRMNCAGFEYSVNKDS